MRKPDPKAKALDPQEEESLLEQQQEQETSDSFDRSFSDRIEEGYAMHSME
jgi:hypothetical protein